MSGYHRGLQPEAASGGGTVAAECSLFNPALCREPEVSTVKSALCSLLLVCGSATTLLAEKAVTLTAKEASVEIEIGGEPFAVYNYSKQLPKPFFHPVRGPGGTVLTRPIERKGDDHPHHKGIWVAVDEVNGVDFWAEKGKIENVSVALDTDGAAGILRTVNHWLDPSGRPILKETTTVTIYPNRLMVFDIRFLPAGNESVTFDDTKEGLFGFRMVNSMREREGGHVKNADGLEGSAACWGKTSHWVDYYGTVQGKTFGVALFDHPGNFRPSRYHVRNYGLFSISPFGEKAYARNDPSPVVLKPGETLRLRYGLYIHQGDTEQGSVAAVYRQFVKASE